MENSQHKLSRKTIKNLDKRKETFYTKDSSDTHYIYKWNKKTRLWDCSASSDIFEEYFVKSDILEDMMTTWANGEIDEELITEEEYLLGLIK
jgi:hypothetical protein